MPILNFRPRGTREVQKPHASPSSLILQEVQKPHASPSSHRARRRGYEWVYQRTFGHRSIWRHRPEDLRAVPPYLAMAYLYKRANPLWRVLIERDLTQWAWRPLVEWSRRRHVELATRTRPAGVRVRLPTVVYASV